MLSERLATAVRIAAEGADLALWHFRRRDELTLNSKRAQDFVSEADTAVERQMRGCLRECFPGDNIIGEELGGEWDDSPSWVIDPIDGTANFLRGSPLWGVSLGLLVKRKPIIGVIILPVLNDVMAAEAGQGLYRNGQPYQRDNRYDTVQMVSLGDSHDDALSDASAFYEGLRRAQWSVECYHCTTVGMVFAAKGIVGGHLQRRTHLWDIAGGLTICAEAGLEVTHGINGDDTRHMSVAAGVPALLRAVRPLWPDLAPC
ncbi:inositol monophosphatase family protein [Martelella alba]|uniref:Inositol monophosphatase n=1 Tax=Martelella alba TaxID=2590451 RepID=A0ABY2SKN7_9HYPH|nr:inositol monophosphatase [Martelella alba]TKI06143.1 inositol monophosphatase [Martelella alba]